MSMSESFEKPWVVVKGSSNIAAYAYDEKTEELTVKFHNGGVYTYSEVPLELPKEWEMASSKGRYFHLVIKGKFPCRKLEE